MDLKKILWNKSIKKEQQKEKLLLQ